MIVFPDFSKSNMYIDDDDIQYKVYPLDWEIYSFFRNQVTYVRMHKDVTKIHKAEHDKTMVTRRGKHSQILNTEN